MKQRYALKSASAPKQSSPVALFAARLTGAQLEALRRCAKGISLRFDASEIVDPLVAGGYAKRGIAGVVTVTAEGHQYLRAHTE
jgi:hypothetical protein